MTPWHEHLREGLQSTLTGAQLLGYDIIELREKSLWISNSDTMIMINGIEGRYNLVCPGKSNGAALHTLCELKEVLNEILWGE